MPKRYCTPVTIERILKRSLVNSQTGCIEWQGALSGNGYGMISVNHDDQVSVHRSMWELCRGPLEKGMCVCHTCDNRRCVNIEHLFIGSYADNNSDKERKGRANHRGARISTPEFVRQIRELYKNGGVTYQQLADRFSVPYARIHSALLGWKTLEK